MADLDVAIRIAAQDSASGPLGAVERALHGLGGAASAPLGAIGGLVHGLGAVGLAANGLGVLGSAFGGLAADAIEAQKVQAATNAVLASTHGVAGVTADAVANLATSFSKVTPFEDEAVQSAENMLLTFTNIGQDVFPQATETVLNMSQALGQDLQSSAVQLGKALQDPITGATALRRVGVALTDEQQDLIKSFVASGDLASAQGVILKELSTEFGGAARAAGETFGGKLAILQTQLGNLKEAAFGPLLGTLGDFAVSLSDIVSSDDFIGWVTSAANAVGGAFTEAISAAKAAFESLQPLFQVVISAFMSLGQVIDRVMAGDIRGALETAGDVANGFTQDLLAIVGQWAQAFIAWVGPMIPPFLEALADFGRQLLGWLRDQIPALVEQLGAWAAAFIDWVAPQVDPLLHELGHLLERVFGWIGDQLPGFLAKLGEWGLSFVEWVAPRIPPLLLELGKLLVEIGGWMLTTALPAIVDKLAAWGRAFIQWVADDVLPNLPGALASIASALGSWIGDTARSIGTWALDLGAQLVRGFISGLASLAGELLSAIRSAILAIEVNAGPFHLSASGFRIDAPQMPTIQLPAPPQPPPGWQTVPAFAAGGVVPGPIGAPMRAVVHGGEMVLPVGSSLRAPAIDYDRLAAAVGQQPIVLQLDGRVLARVTRERLLQVGQRNGNAFGTLGVAGIT